MRITVDAEVEVDLRVEIAQMDEKGRNEIRDILALPRADIGLVEQWIDRIKYKGLDTDLTALEVLEKIDTELEY